MSKPAPAITSVPSPASPQPVRKRRPFWRLCRWLFVLALLGIAALFIPPVFQGAVRGLLKLEAWRHGAQVDIAEVEGSFYEPVVLHDSRWSYRSQAGSVAGVTIQSATADLRWPALLPWQRGRWFYRMTLDGVAANIEIPVQTFGEKAQPAPTPAPFSLALPEGTWWPTPAIVEANRVDVTVRAGENFVRIKDSRWTASEWESGVVAAGQIVVQQPWLKRTFRNVQGTTALQSTKVIVTDLQLDREVVIKHLETDLQEMAKGVLAFDVLASAFGGSMRAEGTTIHSPKQFEMWAYVGFERINIATLATFLGLSEAAGGMIEYGTFNFRGAPTDLPRSTASARFAARNFQWESRQWDSLVFGASLLGERVQVHDLELLQGKNRLKLNGEVAFPKGNTRWWETEFSMEVAARLENLTDLSALVLPDFKYAAGRASIDGSVRGKNQQFHGQLLVSGTDITWRSAPIKELHAAIKLEGNELQLANFDLLNQDDYVHGRGVINIFGAKQYWGELRASVQDLALYSALLQKPIVPEPLAGGLQLNWSGEGSAERYSGGFLARLQKLRTLGASGPQMHPVNAELHGAYAPGLLHFSRFHVSDGASSFSAKLKIDEQSVDLREIRLTQGLEQRLEGEALLPLDVWNAWRTGDAGKLVNESMPAHFALKASNLRLGDALRLSGWKWPLEGSISGQISGKGAGSALEMEGALQVSEGQLPLGWQGERLADVRADLALSGHKLTVANGRAQHATGVYAGQGEIDLSNLRVPAFDLTLQSGEAKIPLLQHWVIGDIPAPTGFPLSSLHAIAQLNLQLRGPATSAALSGTVSDLRFSTDVPLDLRLLWDSAVRPAGAIFNGAPALWSSCKLDLQCIYLIKNNPAGLWEGELKISGTGAAPEIEGTISLRGGSDSTEGRSDETKAIVKSNGFPLHLKSGSITFRPGAATNPTLDFVFEGYWRSLPFKASIIGPLSHRISFIDNEEARDLLTGKKALTYHQAGAEAGASGVAPQIFQWKRIEGASIYPVPPQPSAPEAIAPAPAATEASATLSPAIPSPVPQPLPLAPAPSPSE